MPWRSWACDTMPMLFWQDAQTACVACIRAGCTRKVRITQSLPMHDANGAHTRGVLAAIDTKKRCLSAVGMTLETCNHIDSEEATSMISRLGSMQRMNACRSRKSTSLMCLDVLFASQLAETSTIVRRCFLPLHGANSGI